MSVDEGVLTATSGGGVIVTGSPSGSITLVGSQNDLNTFLGGPSVNYAPDANFNGSDTLSATITDGGASGSGGTGTGRMIRSRLR